MIQGPRHDRAWLDELAEFRPSIDPAGLIDADAVRRYWADVADDTRARARRTAKAGQ